MRRITVVDHLTLDGVVQGPAHPDEDRSEGFERGGWAAPYGDEVQQRVMAEGMARQGELLFGRRTYQSFESAWGGRTDNPFTPVLEGNVKHVASRSLAPADLTWVNSSLL